MKKQIPTVAVLILALMLLMSACAPAGQSTPTPQAPTAPVTPVTALKIGTLKGPAGIAMAYMMESTKKSGMYDPYEFTIDATPDAIVGKLASGEVDIGALPPNLASSVYNKTDGGVVVIALSMFGSLYIMENGDTIQSIADLEGKTLAATGQGSVPEYILSYVLAKNGLTDKVTIEYKSEHSELAALMAANEISLGMLPEPFVSSVLLKKPEMRIALDLAKEYTAASGSAQLPMSCLVVRKEVLENNKAQVDAFLTQYKASIEYANAEPAKTAQLCEAFDIMKADVAQKAIPNCNLVYIHGDDMRKELEAFYQILFEFEPKSIGGKLPDDALYYKD